MYILNKNRFLITLLLWVGATFFSIYKFDFLPLHFFNDSEIIKFLISAEVGQESFGSFYSTAYFYKILFGVSSDIFISIVTMLAVLLVAYQAINASGRNIIFDLPVLYLLAIYFFLSSVFLAQYSKDFIVLLVVSAFIYLVKRGLSGYFCIIALLLFYGFVFRYYWILICLFFIASSFFLEKNYSLIKGFVFFSLLLLFLSVIFEFVLGVPLNFFRSSVNAVRLDGFSLNARTMIVAYLPLGNFLFEWMNAIVTLVFLMFPLPLILFNEIYYYVIFFVISSIFLLSLISHVFSSSFESARLTILFVFSFVFIQSIFEPDYGSFLRHFTPLIPLLIFLYSNKIINK